MSLSASSPPRNDVHAGAPLGSVRAIEVRHAFAPADADPTLALDSTSLYVRPGEFVAMLGPSGCGKTTLLNAFAGLVTPTGGTVSIDGVRVDGIRADVGYMFARDGLMPWRSALDNVAFGLEVRGVARKERERVAVEHLRLVGLGDFLYHRRQELSQGMRQRVALARTLATGPRIILMDEPFAALDAQTKADVQEEFLKIWERDHRTVVFVTHDIDEAIVMADRIVVFSRRPGRIVGEFTNALARPRSVRALHDDPVFRALRQSIGACLQTHSTATQA